MTDRRGGTAGFTVVEVLVALTILVIATIPILMVLRSATSAEAAQTASIDATRSGAVAVERISADIRSATSMQISAGVLSMTVVDRSGASVAVTWARKDAALIRTVTVAGKPTSSVVLDDLSTLNPAAPFAAFDQNGNKVLTAAVTCPGYVSVNIERATRTGIDHLAFDVASRNLNAGSGSC